MYRAGSVILSPGDRRRRRHRRDGRVAQSGNQYHFKRARWRRLHRQQIQDWIIVAVQNIACQCDSTGADVAVKQPKRLRQGAAAARSAFSSSSGASGARYGGIALFLDNSAGIRAA